MQTFIIEGGHPLQGEVTVAGNKNAALPIIAATVLTDEPCILTNLPAIRDVEVMLQLLQSLGKTVERLDRNAVRIHGDIRTTSLDESLAGQLRASILFLGALLARAGEATLPPPGGCVIGRRGLETHFEALQPLGAVFESLESGFRATLPRPTAGDLFLVEPSVTATENALLLAAAIPGKTVIENAACEPHVVDLAQVLVKMGARLTGAGTNRIEIEGSAHLGGFEHDIVADHIEAATFAIAAACLQSEIVIHRAESAHLRMPAYYWQQMGMDFRFEPGRVLHIRPARLRAPARKIQVAPWPGFPTDLLSPMIVLATQAEGTTLCHDWMFESRMYFVDKLIAMGANITVCDPHRVLVSGPTLLRGQTLSSPDIRAGIALLIAALRARGRSEIRHAELIDRGYEAIDERLRRLGSRIERQAAQP